MEDLYFDYGRAVECYESGNLDGAEKRFLIGASQKNSRAFVYLGAIYCKQKKIAESDRCVQKAIKLANCYKVYYQLGYAFKCIGEMKEAKKYFKLAVESGIVAAENWLGNIYYNEGKKAKAFEWFQSAANKGFARALYNLGVWYADQNNLVEAKKNYELAVELKYVPANAELGYICFNEGDLKKAKKYFKAAAKTGCVYALDNLGEVYQSLNPPKIEKAMRCYDKAALRGSEEAQIAYDELNSIKHK